jgi:micrococcal nuclease
MKDIKSFIITVIFILVTSFIVWITIINIRDYIQKYKNTYQERIIGTTTWNIEEFTLLKVIDWDTIKVKDQNNNIQNIRMVGLDAPEKSTTRYWYSECFWEEATTHLEKLLSWINTLELEFDPTQTTTDKYWRLLWYVFLSWTNINKQMIEDWYWFEYTYNLPYKYQKEFKKAENHARINNLWLRNKDSCNGERGEYKE